MSEVHENEENTNEDTMEGAPNGGDTTVAKKTHREAIVETSVSGDVISYKFTNDEIVTVDVSKLPANVQHDELIAGVRNTGRLSFQKEEDPAKAAKALREKLARMMKGESHAVGRVARKECTPLTEALARIAGKTVKEIEEEWYDTYFHSAKSGCNFITIKGKERIYGKQIALERLLLDDGIKKEVDKVMSERRAKLAKSVAASGGAAKVDVVNMMTPATPPTAA